MKTTRQHIERQLRLADATATGLAEQIDDAEPSDVLEHIRHIARSIDNDDEELFVIPPECRDCGFDGYDDLINIPSKCPACRSRNVSEPVFTIE